MLDDRIEPPDDELLTRVVTELVRPVELGTDLDQRVLRILRARGASPVRPSPASRTRTSRWGLGLAAAAVLVVVAAVRLLSGGLPAPAEPTVPPRTIEFSLSAPSSSRVAIVGDFNDWSPSASPLTRASGTGVWTVRIPLSAGRYRYSFLVDGDHWVGDPGEPPAVDDDFGAPISVVTVYGGSI